MPVELGALDYGFPIDGILGLDFMRQVGLVIDLDQLRAVLKGRPPLCPRARAEARPATVRSEINSRSNRALL